MVPLALRRKATDHSAASTIRPQTRVTRSASATREGGTTSSVRTAGLAMQGTYFFLSIGSLSMRFYRHLVIAAKMIEADGDGPGKNEYANDQIPYDAEVAVERRDRLPKWPLQIELAADEPQRFDSADQQRRQDGNEGNGQVVVELANGSGECPAVSAEHQHTVGRVRERHSGGEERWEDEDAPDAHALCGTGGRNTQQANLRSGVEAKAEEQAERYMCQLRWIIANSGRRSR